MTSFSSAQPPKVDTYTSTLGAERTKSAGEVGAGGDAAPEGGTKKETVKSEPQFGPGPGVTATVTGAVMGMVTPATLAPWM